MRNSPHKHIYLLFLFFVLLFYGNSLKNKYALDDNFVTVTNAPEKVREKEYMPDNVPVSQGLRGIPQIWRSRYAHDGEGSFDYRPFVTTTFAIEYGIFGQNPFVNHLVNLLIYFLCVCLVYKCVLTLFSARAYRENLAFLCAFIFLIHPLHTEAVDNIKSRDELLSFMFSLLALIYSFRFFDKASIKDGVIIVLCLLLGMFTKRTAILSFVVIPMLLYFFRPVNIRKLLLPLLGLMVVYAVFAISKQVMLKETGLRTFYHFENALFTDHPTIIGRLSAALKTFGIYIKLLVLPFPMRFYYGERVFDMSAGIGLYSLVSLLFVALSGWYFFKTKNKYFLYAFLLFFGSIFPFLNFFTPVAGVIGDRLAFTASFGFCLMLCIVLLPYFDKLNLKKPQLRTFTTRPFSYLSALALACLVCVISRNNDWYDRFRLFVHDSEYLEDSSKGNSLLANEYLERMNKAKNGQEAQTNAANALKHYQLALRADSSMYSSYNNAGVVLFSFYKQYAEAARYFRLGIRARPAYAQAYENLANTYKMRLKYDSAVMLYHKASTLR